MVWTSPRTWSVSDVADAAALNTHLRDNLLEIGPHVRVVKAADETAPDSTLQDDDHLFFQVGANETWLFAAVLLESFQGGPQGLIATFVGPTGSTIVFGVEGPRNDGTNPLTFPTSATGGSTITGNGLLFGRVANGATSGVVRLRWASALTMPGGEPRALTLAAGSALIAHRVG